MNESEWPPIAVLGAGAVGCYFGGMLARAGAPVTLIGRSPHVETIARSGLFLESLRFQERIRVGATTEVASAGGAAVILFCVKTVDTEEAARSLAPHLAANACVVSLQNGIDNAEMIHAQLREVGGRSETGRGVDVIPAVVYVAAEMTAPGCVKHTGRGDLIIGELPGGESTESRVQDAAAGGANAGPLQERLASLARLFPRAGVPCRVSETIEADLWAKLVTNCAYNAISALGGVRYGPLVTSPWARETMRQAVLEAIAVARAAGVRLSETDTMAAVWALADAVPGAISSTAQDLARGRPTEIDSLNGYVARRGREMGVPTPVNETLHALVKLAETAGAHQ